MDLPTITKDAIAISMVAVELQKARAKHANMASPHDAYAIILEEVDEFWEEVKNNTIKRNPDDVRIELIQIAAMCIRAITDLNLTLIQGEQS